MRPRKTRKAGYRWKNNVIFKVYIDTASTAKMWRLRTARGKSEPHPIEELNVPVSVKVGSGHTYVGTVTIRRIKTHYLEPERYHGLLPER